jgi:glyceraldehyde-3-phosphate dehydrogenase (NADP+)
MKSLILNGSYINGELYYESTNDHLEVVDKYSKAQLASIPFIDSQGMNKALESADTAFESLSKMSSGERAEKLFKLKELLDKKKKDFAELISAEAGKPITYAIAEVERCLTTISLAAEEARRFCGETIAVDYGAGTGKTAYTKPFPIGVIACISPFNFPLNLALHKIAPALAVGNSVVLKPSPYAPLSALAMAKLIDKAGFPKGSVNVVICEVPLAEKLIKDERVKMISFTGSPAIGWHLKSISGKKKIILELGGNAAVIIDRTADLDLAAKKVAVGAYLYAGQICISTQRIYVDNSVYVDFKKKLVSEIAKLEIGDPRLEKTQVGPLIDKVHLQRVNAWVKEAITEGATVLTGGKILDDNSNIFAPTLLENTNKEMKVCKNEVFGPVAILEKVQFFDEAIQKVNDSNFGLQAGLFTNQIDQMKYAFDHLEVGGLMINNIPGFRVDSMPYGGVKDSGLGREGLKYAMKDMTESRLLVF